jgi:hypothetical protein
MGKYREKFPFFINISPGRRDKPSFEKTSTINPKIKKIAASPSNTFANPSIFIPPIRSLGECPNVYRLRA